MNIEVKVIPHEEQRYPTVGDWLFLPNSSMSITVSSMENEDYEFLVGIHEQIEAYLCKKRGIKEEDVSAFDKNFERGRLEDNFDEPGAHPMAPYFNEHMFATKIEHLISDELGVDWDAYDKAVISL